MSVPLDLASKKINSNGHHLKILRLRCNNSYSVKIYEWTDVIEINEFGWFTIHVFLLHKQKV
jgi:hypothetical protein